MPHDQGLTLTRNLRELPDVKHDLGIGLGGVLLSIGGAALVTLLSGVALAVVGVLLVVVGIA